MKRRISILILNSAFLILNSLCYSQNKIDSLFSLLKTDKPDTVKINHLNSLGWELNSAGAYLRADSVAREGLKLSDALHFKKGISTAFSNIGIAYDYLGDYPHALEYYFKSLKSSEDNADKHGVLAAYSNIGNVFTEKGDFLKGLNYYFKALKMAEELGEKKKIAGNLNNIGVVYKNQGDFAKALEYYLRSLKIAREIGNKSTIANKLGNIGSIYYYQLNYAKALEYYLNALKLYEELKNKNGIARNICNIGLLYKDEGDNAQTAGNIPVMNEKYNRALEYYLKAFKIGTELEEKNMITASLGAIGSVYTGQKKYREAFKCLYRGLAISDSIGTMDYSKDYYNDLSALYQTSNVALPDSTGGQLLNMEQMRLRALYYHKRYIAIRDTLFSEENKKQLVRKEMNFEFEKKEAEAKAEQDKKDAVATADAKRQKIVLLLVSFVLLLVAVVAFIIFRSLRITRRQKALIEKQKQIVEEHQKEILDSIYYARRIQRSLLTSEKYIARILSRSRAKPHD